MTWHFKGFSRKKSQQDNHEVRRRAAENPIQYIKAKRLSSELSDFEPKLDTTCVIFAKQFTKYGYPIESIRYHAVLIFFFPSSSITFRSASHVADSSFAHFVVAC